MVPFILFTLQFQDLLLAKMEEEEGSGETDDAAYADIEEEVLGEIDSREGTQGGKHQQRQQRQMKEDGAEGLVCLAGSLTAIGQKEGEAGAEYEERRGMTGGEGIAVVHVDTRHQGQCAVREALEGAYRTLQAQGVFQQL